jgi:hypothetical protein
MILTRLEMPFLESERDSCLCEIVWTDLNFDVVTWQDTDAIFSQFARQVADNLLIVFKFYLEASCGQCLEHFTTHFDELFFRHNWR